MGHSTSGTGTGRASGGKHGPQTKPHSWYKDYLKMDHRSKSGMVGWSKKLNWRRGRGGGQGEFPAHSNV